MVERNCNYGDSDVLGSALPLLELVGPSAPFPVVAVEDVGVHEVDVHGVGPPAAAVHQPPNAKVTHMKRV